MPRESPVRLPPLPTRERLGALSLDTISPSSIVRTINNLTNCFTWFDSYEGEEYWEDIVDRLWLYYDEAVRRGIPEERESEHPTSINAMGVGRNQYPELESTRQ